MNLEMKFSSGELGSIGQCVYCEADLALEYVPVAIETDSEQPTNLLEVIHKNVGLKQDKRFYLISDTLTLVFDGADNKLLSLDAYTNKAHWRESRLRTVPRINDSGSISIIAVPPGADRWSTGIVPHYEIAPDSDWIRVIFGDEKPEIYYEVARDLVVGLAHQTIIEIFLLSVVYR